MTRITLRYLSCSSSASQNIKVSSPYYECVLSKLSVPSLATSNPLNNPLIFAIFILLFKPLIVIRNKKKDKGSPYVSSLCVRKNPTGLPLMRIEKLIVGYNISPNSITFARNPSLPASSLGTSS